jgi:hypothetical protein
MFPSSFGHPSGAVPSRQSSLVGCAPANGILINGTMKRAIRMIAAMT